MPPVTGPDDAPRASSVWQVEIVTTRRPRPIVAARWLVSVVTAFFLGAFEGEWPGFDVVVRERSTGREIHRLAPQGLTGADESKLEIEADLDRLTCDEYCAEWKLA
jgi:hypothetical protein